MRARNGGSIERQSHSRSFWDGLLFGFSASLTLWQDLPASQAIIVLVVVFGAALVALWGSE